MSFDIDVPSRGDIVHELEKIVEEFSLGSALRERALYRLWRIWKDKSYLDILNDDPSIDPPEPKYYNWGSFLKDFLEQVGVSRSTVYSRMKAYSILEWIGYSDKEILEKMSESSVGYGHSVNLLVDWNMTDNAPIDIKADFLGTLEDEESVKKNIREVLDNTIPVYEKTSDAIEHIKRDLIGSPVVGVWQDGGEIVINYEDTATGESGWITFSPDVDYPLWVCDMIEKRYRIKRRIVDG